MAGRGRFFAGLIFAALGAIFLSANISAFGAWPDFLVLPDFLATPDGMAVCPATGSLIVACPNFGDLDKPACLIHVDQNGTVRKWVDVPILAETGKAFPMGIAFGPDGDLWVCDNQNWPTGNGDDGQLNQGRLLKLRIEKNRVTKTTVVADGISHPNGVKIRDGFAYMTVSCLPKIHADDGLLRSAVYRFRLDDANVHVQNTAEDPNLFVLLTTKNKDCPYGADGICFDADGNLIIGNFGDGELLKVTTDGEPVVSLYARSEPIPPLNLPDGTLDENFLDKAVKVAMRTTDGICRGEDGTVYVADFSNNAVARVTQGGKKIDFLAVSPDSDGLAGQLNQPGEPCLWNGRLAVTCFDMVAGPDKVNTRHDAAATLVFLKP